ncbi:uncharacterized protein si:ch211-40k21.5 isoform X1 [Nerophis ophidion]|uniref:uncharacterized protein si:ch211-40k21.5 isoform X1 n=1 Tax=Nerophis ophidion TaxID=159077 RepID=UPI002ADF4CE1|nr:uncharacterized protein si:ch211-40k21.5 isoform X1 [Nerophis ophidion]XP_061771924.1 uncharacterized protein si:ch211-40k21.5 isoform X1 [Nerophis ophidion]
MLPWLCSCWTSNSSAKHLGFGGNVIHSCLTADRNRRNKPLTAVGGTTEDFTPIIGAVGGPETEEDSSDTGEDSGSSADGVMAFDDTLAAITKVGSAEVLLTSPETLRVITASPGPPTAYTGFRGLFVNTWSLFSTAPKPAKTI